MRWLLFPFILYTVCHASENSEKSASENNVYAFYYPLTVSAKQVAQVCFAIEKHLLPATVKISFVNSTCDETCDPHIVNSGFECWKINIPDRSENNHWLTTIVLEIETKDKDIKFKEEKQLRIYSNDEQTILETDRSVYKMGDIVKIRIVALDFDLKPAKDYKISSVAIKSPHPSYAIVKEWHNISVNLGLIHLEFQLAPDTPEGYWSINGGIVYGGFEVKKYILPRFQVLITGPDRIYNGSKSVSYIVCGKYSYGRNLKGVALLEAKSRYNYDHPLILSQVKDLKNGCAKFELFSEDLGLNRDRVWSIDLTASVTEDGTEQIESATKYTYVSRDPYSYAWNHKDGYIKPKLPYKGTFSLTDVNVPLNNSDVELCYKLDPATNRTCSNFSLDSNNRIEFTVPPIKNIAENGRFEIQATVFDWPLAYKPSLYLNIWHSTSKDGIEILDEEQNLVNCGSSLTYTILYNSGRFKEGQEVEFKYILTSRGEILNTGSVIEKPKRQPLNLDNYQNVIGKETYETEDIPVDKFELKIQLDNKIYTTSKLLVYYDYENEVISDIIDVDVNKCSPNQVNAKWAEDSLYPGEVGTLNIKTDRGSLCSISSIDKASTFLGSNNRINIGGVLNRFYRYYSDGTLNCNKPKNETTEETDTTPFSEIWRMHGYYSSLYDSYEAFKDSKIGVISNLKFISKECQSFYTTALAGPAPVPEVAVETLSLGAGSAERPTGFAGGADNKATIDDRGSAIRSFFPETWLWDLVPVQEGEIKLERKLPDSITDWQGNVLCMSAAKGLGISDQVEIKGFKPFFVDILLPYSIKRNKEILHLPIPVFNYLNHSLPIRVTLESNADIVLVDGQDKNSFSMCLAAEDSYTHNYRIKATKLGSVSVTVSANVDPAYAENCAPDSVIRRRDVVQKPLLVEPEGYPSSLVKSALLCANDTLGVDNVEWNINLPENVVADTIDGKVTINSDILGPMFQNLENILVVPTGCGEQTMATLTPNLYVMQYLQANNALTDKTKEKIVKNLEIGYQRMLTYVHDDGSFSAFGKSDKDGSMFLTAFVIRTFRQIKKYIFIDDHVINKAMKWLITHQLENGCFDPVHHVFHEMGLASSKNQTTALTSYVLISILETNTKFDDNILSKAKECIVNDTTVDKYTLAISSYALGLINITQKAKERLDKLLEVATNENGLLWWKQSDKSLSANVEVASYVLMSLLQQDPVANLGTASSIVRWLQSQMNPRGGFFSTVDTVVGLDSISRYATLVNKKEPNVKILLATKTDKRDIQITKRDRTKPEILPLATYPNEVKAKIEGDGCVAIQTAVNYYLDKPATLDDLKLDIELKPVNQKFKCSLIELKPCVSYASLGEINMAIIEVNMPSGYAPDQASLYALKTTNDSGVKKFELIRNQVVFYLTRLGADKVCLPFTIEENLIVENVANATVKLYDYYKPEISISKSFKLEDCEANIAVPA